MEAALRAGRLGMCMNTVKCVFAGGLRAVRGCVCVCVRACTTGFLSQSLSPRRALAPLPLTSHLPGGLPPADRCGLLLLPPSLSPSFSIPLPFFSLPSDSSQSLPITKNPTASFTSDNLADIIYSTLRGGRWHFITLNAAH